LEARHADGHLSVGDLDVEALGLGGVAPADDILDGRGVITAGSA
jgi:hypothetical protein